jgi:hypothetical protein
MLFFGKCCILSYYHRIFGHMTRVRYQLYGTLLLSLSLVVAAVLMPIWIGPPVWGSAPESSPSSWLTISIGVIKLVVDLLILYIPIPIVLKMKLTGCKKIGVLATFLTGSM